MIHARRTLGARAIVLAGALSCAPKSADTVPSPSTPVSATTTTTPEATPTSDAGALPPGAWHVGVLSQSGRPDCSNGQEQWVDTRPVIGWISTGPLSAEEEAWLDHPVIAHGKWTTEPQMPTTTVKGECPTPQARSDWELTPRGIRIRRGGGRFGGEHLERDHMQPLVDLRATADAEQLTIDFRNPLPVALAEVVVRVHYEGCMGKPGTMSREHVVGALEQGAGTRVQLPRLAARSTSPGDPPEPPDHAARSVQIEATGTDVTFDLDVPLAVLGVKVGCPKR